MLISCLRFSLQICGKSGLTSGLTSDVVSSSSTGSKSNYSFFLDSGVFVCRFIAECVGSFVLVECGVIGVFRKVGVWSRFYDCRFIIVCSGLLSVNFFLAVFCKKSDINNCSFLNGFLSYMLIFAASE